MPHTLADGEQQAAVLTASAQEAVHIAARLLLRGFDRVPMINSLGIYANPSLRRAELVAARASIGRAITAIDALLPPSHARPRAARVALLFSRPPPS